MTQKNGDKTRQTSGADERAERLRAALRANLGRRKAQARARAAGDAAAPESRDNDRTGPDRQE